MKFTPPIPSCSNENFCFHVGDYSFGFNGKDKESEFNSGAYDFGARIHDARLGRWMSVDAFVNQYPFVSPFAFVLNSPNSIVDPDGNRIIGWMALLANNQFGASARLVFQSPEIQSILIKFNHTSAGEQLFLFNGKPIKGNNTCKDVRLGFNVVTGLGSRGSTMVNYTTTIGPDGILQIENIQIAINIDDSIIQNGEKISAFIHEMALHLDHASKIIEDYYKTGDAAAFVLAVNNMTFDDHTNLALGKAVSWEKASKEVDDLLVLLYNTNGKGNDDIAITDTGLAPTGVLPMGAAQVNLATQYDIAGTHPYSCDRGPCSLMSDPEFNRFMPNAAGVEEYRGSAMATYTNFRFFTYSQYDFYLSIPNR